MPDGGDMLTVRTVTAIADIGRAAWDACADPPGAAYHPFTSYDFLSALEESRSVGDGAGWIPMHLVLEEGTRIKGVAPFYLKSHSQGEYVFDHHWADAYERAGGRYYPKLISAIPFTPVPGPRLLAADAENRKSLASAVAQAARQLQVSSAHVNFIPIGEADEFAALGFLRRSGVQYHWFNRGYAGFDEFLATLSSRKRKAIRRERSAVAESGLVIRHYRGAEIAERHWDAVWAFYQHTGSRKWGRPYLTRNFFSLVGERMPERCLIVLAERDGIPVAGALNFIGGDALYGRYWGCLEQHPFLHFELCYYQAIEFAIEHRLSRVEAGAQGEHKVARGYEPAETLSAHWIADPNFRRAIDRYLQSERAHVSAELEALNSMTPFRRGAGDE